MLEGPEGGLSIRVCETGRFSGVELRRDLRVCDEVDDERDTELEPSLTCAVCAG